MADAATLVHETYNGSNSADYVAGTVVYSNPGEGYVTSQALEAGPGFWFDYYGGSGHFNQNRGTLAFWIKPVNWDPTTAAWYNIWFNGGNTQVYTAANQIIVLRPYRDLNDKETLDGYPTSMAQGSWSHLVFKWLDRVLWVYFNGALSQRQMMLIPFDVNTFRLNFSNGTLTSRINDLYIWDFCLSDAEINTLYTSGTTPSLPQAQTTRVNRTIFPGAGKVYVDIVTTAAGAATVAVYCVKPDTTEVSIGTLTFTGGEATDTLDLPAITSDGTIYIKAYVKDGGGSTIDTQSSEGFAWTYYSWLNNSLGVSDAIISPFTAMVYNAGERSITCYGRKYTFKADGFPDTMRSRDVDMVASVSLTLTIGGSAFTLGSNWSLDTNTDGKKVFTNSTTISGTTVLITGTMEQDGFITYEVTITPTGSASIGYMALSIPVKNANAKLYHAVRTNNTGVPPAAGAPESAYIPLTPNPGIVWASGDVPNDWLQGTFIPYWWIGDYDRGVCWMADSDKNWSNSDSTDAVSFTRGTTYCTAEVFFITTAKTITEATTYKFGIMCTPTRPEPTGWRWQDPKLTGPFNQTGDSDYQFEGYNKIVYPTAYNAKGAEWLAAYNYFGANFSPADVLGNFPVLPKNDVLEDHYFWLDWDAGRTVAVGSVHPSRNDFVLYGVDNIFDGGLYSDGVGGQKFGFYVDNSYLRPFINLTIDQGYTKDDGSPQPGYGVFIQRDFYKRLATIFRQSGCTREMVAHMTATMVAPVFFGFDAKWDMEWDLTSAGNDPVDVYSNGFIAARVMSRQWGMLARWFGPNYAYTSNSYDDMLTVCLIHDIIPPNVSSLGGHYDDRVTNPFNSFGMGESDVEFKGYWELQPGTTTDDAERNMKISAWTRANHTALVVVGNLSGSNFNGSITLPMDLIGISTEAAVYVTTVQNGSGSMSSPYTLLGAGPTVNLAVDTHNFRLLYLVGSNYTRGDYGSLPSADADLEIPYTSSDIANVATVDGIMVAQSAPSQYAIHEFKNDASGKSTCTVTWTGQTTLGNTIDFPTILEIYNTNTHAWVELDRNTDADPDTNFELTFPITSGLDNYKDTNGFITCRVYQSSISR